MSALGFGPGSFVLPREFFSATGDSPSTQGVSPVSFGGVSLPLGFMALDYAASTPLHLAVFDAMRPWLFAYFGNPAARIHAFGDLADYAVQQSRDKFAQMLLVDSGDIVFTSSATESNNLVLRGLVTSPFRQRKKILYVATEHASVVTTARELQRLYGASHGIIAQAISVDECGQVQLDAFQSQLDDETLLVCVMDVNNETGVVQQRLPEMIELAHRAGAYVHVDAVQGAARGTFASRNMDWDTLTISSGKIYGPRGAALLAIRKRSPKIRIEPQLTGGGHESGLRSSTLNVAAIVGFAKAMEMQEFERAERNAHLETLEREFKQELRQHAPAVFIAEGTARVPGILMVQLPGTNAMKLIERCRVVAVGVGSACRTLHATASHVLLEMGWPLDEALACFRVSVGLPNTVSEVREAARCLGKNSRKT